MDQDLEHVFGDIFLLGLPPEGPQEEALTEIKTLGLRHFILFKRDLTLPQAKVPPPKDHLARELPYFKWRKALEGLGIMGLWAVDQEGGPVVRLLPPLCPPLRAPLELAESPHPEDALAREARKCAQALKDLGINFNLAPVLDLADQKAPRFLQARTLGKDPNRVAALAQIYLEVFKSFGLLCCGKHFPGLGGVSLDPHLDLPRIKNISSTALIPFAQMVKASVPALMTTHLIVEGLGEEPATFSPALVRMIREDLRFSGAILTDDLDMGAISKHWSLPEAIEKALWAGHDLLLICQDFWRAIEAIKDFKRQCRRSKALRRRVAQAAGRVARLMLYR